MPEIYEVEKMTNTNTDSKKIPKEVLKKYSPLHPGMQDYARAQFKKKTYY